MKNTIFLATDWKGIHRARFDGTGWQTSDHLEDIVVHCLTTDPTRSQTVYAGTRQKGVLRSSDGGLSWTPMGMEGVPVKALAVDPQQPDVIYAGANPVSLYVTRDQGSSWEELPALRNARKWWWFSPADPPGITPYVQALSVSPGDSNVILAGIELGAVLRSDDGGMSWTPHLKGTIRDCHSLRFHPSNPNWAYEGGAGGIGASFSRDGGRTWQQPEDRRWKLYGWMVAADFQRPEVWYLSASRQPSLLRGEFIPPAHNDGKAGAHIYRSVGGAPLETLRGGLPDPLHYMAYALIPDPHVAGGLYAGMAHGEIWRTLDYGDTWEKLPVSLGGIHRDMVMIA